MTLTELIEKRSPWQVGLNSPPKPSPYMNVADAEKMMKAAGALGEWDYARDHHFKHWIYEDLKTPEDVQAFLAQLDKDSDYTGCIKAREIRSMLASPFWSENMDRIKSAISSNRRVCCGCHESGSFAKRKR
jgi:hypothetical protein